MNGPLTDSLKQLERAVTEIPTGELASLIGCLEKLKATALTRICCPTLQVSGTGELLTAKEVSAQLRISQYRAYELLRTGQIKATRLGRSVRVKLADLDEYISTQSA